MATSVRCHFKDLELDEELRTEVEKRGLALAGEFPELEQVELTISPDGSGHRVSAHATGKDTELASHAVGGEPGHAADRVLDKLRHQLRRSHDKRIFSHRRDARQSHPRRNGPEGSA